MAEQLRQSVELGNSSTTPQSMHEGQSHQDGWLAEPSSTSSNSPTKQALPNQALPSLAAKRKAASQFIRDCTGVSPPYATDQGFRTALKDGVLLCKVVNTVWPDAVKQILEAGDVEYGPSGLLAQRDHNVHAFLAALGHIKQVPSDCMFSIADLEAEHEERPQVANCLIFIKGVAQAHQYHASTMQPTPFQQHSPHSQQHQQPQGMYTDSNVRSSMEDQMMTTPPPQRSSCGGRLQQHGQHQQHQYGLVTPGSVGQLYGHNSPSTRLSFAGTTPGSAGSFGAMLARGTPPGNQLPAPLHSPLMDGHGSLRHSHGSLVPYHSSSSSLTPASMQGASITAATHKSVQAAAGVTRLMQQCTHMLKERMFPNEQQGLSVRQSHPAGATPDTAMKALGPVLEGVLGQLTEEYERRLLSKDHDLSKAQEAQRKAENTAQRLQEERDQLRRDVDDRSRAAAKASEDSCAAEAAQLRAQVQQLQAALAEKDAELSRALSALSNADSAHLDAYHALQAEAMMLRTRLGELLPIEDKYKAVLLENRDLYNTVQDLRGNIRVFCRIRPPGVTGDLSPACVDVGLEGDLAVYDQASGIKRVFKVDRVFDQGVNQSVVYEDTQPLIRSVLDGYNVCIFAYGQTGSGKTHTMSGTNTEDMLGRGINYRALDDLFGIRDSRPESEYTFRVQMLEIYNENLRDLLVDGRHTGSVSKLDILATQASGCNVPGATQVDVHNAHDVVSLMARGASQRATSETKMNDRSSRSHQILTVIVDGFNSVTKAASHGCLHLIDLAGSERVGKSEASGDRLVEAQHINKSLSALGDVMAALAAKNTHVPYRNSKLTQLLQDSLQGNAKVMMFMHISPEANMFSESVSTLKFATRVSQITLGQAKKNVVSGKVFEAHEEINKTQETLRSKDQQIQQLTAVAEHQHSEIEHQRGEIEALRAQLQQAQAQHQPAQQQQHRPTAAGRLSDADTPLRAQLQLPLQQMLAQQQQQQQHQAAVAALSSRGAGLSESTVNGSPMAAGGGGSPFTVGATDSPQTSKIGRMRIDKTPPRDQDDQFSLASELSRATLETPLYSQEGPDPTPLRTARSSRSTGGAMRASQAQHAREMAAAERHAARLSTSRQSGQYRTSSGGGAGSGTAGAGGSGAATGSPGGSTLGSMISKGFSKVSNFVHPSGSSTSRAPKDVDRVPMTSRVSSVPGRSNRLSEVSHIPSFSSSSTSRQGGVYGGSKHASGAVTARPAATGRSGTRWK